MGDEAKPSVLKRKALDGLAGHKARSMTPEKAMSLGMALSAQNGLGLACEVTRVRRSLVSHETLVGMLDSDSLLAILEGENGARAALAIDMQVLSGFVECQTLGRVLPQPAGNRVPTLVDAALVTPFVEDTLARFVTLLNVDAPPEWLQHYKFGAVTEDTRTLSLSLKAFEYQFFLMDIALEGGVRKGTFGIAFPMFEAVDIVEPSEAVSDEKVPSESGVMRANVKLSAVVGRLQMPIGEVQTLKIGQLLALPAELTQETTLEGVDGTRVTGVRLGQINGMRAVRLVGSFAPVGAAPEHVAMDEMDDENGGGGTELANTTPVVAPRDPEPVNVVPEPEVPELPDLDAAMDGLGDFDLPDLGGLPELPDLPDLPDLADLDLTGS